MATIIKKSLDEPEETKNFPKMKAQIVSVNGFTVKRITAEPGWQWSKHIKPVEGGESCQKHHFLYVISGRVRARMDDGKEEEFGPGEAGIIPTGHDGWTVGGEPAVWIEMPH
jgi:quercetin dioxygenase-like cupin family protein